eukprot:scaffold2848_cov352-Pavlova_lutheri.AAC.21
MQEILTRGAAGCTEQVRGNLGELEEDQSGRKPGSGASREYLSGRDANHSGTDTTASHIPRDCATSALVPARNREPVPFASFEQQGPMERRGV